MSWGKKTGCYLGEEQIKRIDEAINLYPVKYKSQNHFIRCAVEILLRKVEEDKERGLNNEVEYING